MPSNWISPAAVSPFLEGTVCGITHPRGHHAPKRCPATTGLTLSWLSASSGAGNYRRLKASVSLSNVKVKGISRAVHASVDSPSQTQSPLFALSQGQAKIFQTLPSGLRLEVISQLGRERSSGKAPLVFIHGSYHAAWCWAEHWLPFFSDRGHDCYAISLLGQGGSDTPPEKVAGDLQSHARDVAYFIQSNLTNEAVLVGHSFGGLIVQYYLGQMSHAVERPSNVALEDHYPKLAAAILLCSVPPTGNGGIVQRYVLSRPITAVKVTLSLAAKMFSNSLSLCRESFFSPDMPDDQVKRYQELLRTSSRIPLFDLRKLNASLPVALPVSTTPPVLVVGAENDFLVDHQGVDETHEFFKGSKELIRGVAHDVMLDTRWKQAALILASWIETTLM